MKIVIIVVLIFVLIVGSAVGYITNRERIDQWRRERWIARVFSEENYQKLEELFKSIKEELEQFTLTLKESDMIYIQESYVINFPLKGDNLSRFGNFGNRNQILVYDGDIIREKSTDSFVEGFIGDSQLAEILNTISRTGVIQSIDVAKWQSTSAENIRISFWINTIYTPFIVGNYNFPNAIFYIEGAEGLDEIRYRKVGDGWYIWISPGPG